MNEKIDLNVADVAALMTLPRVGEKLAKRIIEYRETVRPFAEVIELAAVPGISEQMVREMEDRLIVTDPLDEFIIPEETGWDNYQRELEETRAVNQEIPVAVSSPDPIMASPPAPSPAPPVSPNSEPSRFWEHLFATVFGGFLGIAGTLGILWLLNGSLLLNEKAQIDNLEMQLSQAAEMAIIDQEAVHGSLEAMNARLTTVATQESETADSLTSVQTSLATVQADTVDLSSAAEEIEAAVVALDERIAAVAASAETFDTFLDGLQNLLNELRSDGAAVSSTVTATPTPTLDVTVTPTAAAEETPSPTAPGATRTPRPTATPLALPTNTPAP